MTLAAVVQRLRLMYITPFVITLREPSPTTAPRNTSASRWHDSLTHNPCWAID